MPLAAKRHPGRGRGLTASDQHGPSTSFRLPAINVATRPDNRMPVIIGTAPADRSEAVFESDAVLLYLAEETGQSVPRDMRGRKTVAEWLFWQVGGLGPTAGQNHHFGVYAPEKIPCAIARYVDETNRLDGVLDAAWPATASSPGRVPRSPTWRPVHGSCRGSASSRIRTASSICGAGSTRSGDARPPSAPARRATRSPSRP